MKIQFGHGGHKLEGWLNLEQHEADITKPLAFKNDSVDFIFIEHVLEHVTPQQGYRFLEESYRTLKPDGVIRVIVPDVHKVYTRCTPGYLALLEEGSKTWFHEAGLVRPNKLAPHDAVKALVFCHGHQAVYNSDLLWTLIESVGLTAKKVEYGKSNHTELNGVDSHWKYMGLENCILESCVVEGTK